MRSAAHDEWAAVAQLLAQLLAAHTGSIQDAVTRDMADAALSTLAAAACSPVGTTEKRYPLYHFTCRVPKLSVLPQPHSAQVHCANAKAATMFCYRLFPIPACSALQQLPQLLTSARHATFQRVLSPLLLPCLALVTQHVMQEGSADSPQVLLCPACTLYMLHVSSAQQPGSCRVCEHAAPSAWSVLARAAGAQPNYHAVCPAAILALLREPCSLRSHACVLPSRRGWHQ
jgi:hypothetical protein